VPSAAPKQLTFVELVISASKAVGCVISTVAVPVHPVLLLSVRVTC
jgi:hypothetical protein